MAARKTKTPETSIAASIDVEDDIVEIRHDIAGIRHDVGCVKAVVIEQSRELEEIRVSLDKKVDRAEVEGIAQGVVARGR